MRLVTIATVAADMLSVGRSQRGNKGAGLIRSMFRRMGRHDGAFFALGHWKTNNTAPCALTVHIVDQHTGLGYTVVVVALDGQVVDAVGAGKMPDGQDGHRTAEAAELRARR